MITSAPQSVPPFAQGPGPRLSLRWALRFGAAYEVMLWRRREDMPDFVPGSLSGGAAYEENGLKLSNRARSFASRAQRKIAALRPGARARAILGVAALISLRAADPQSRDYRFSADHDWPSCAAPRPRPMSARALPSSPPRRRRRIWTSPSSPPRLMMTVLRSCAIPELVHGAPSLGAWLARALPRPPSSEPWPGQFSDFAVSRGLLGLARAIVKMAYACALLSASGVGANPP